MEYTNTNQINIMDYWSLVNMLMNQISPDIRKQILERLTEMNNQLLMENLFKDGMSVMQTKNQPDLARAAILNSRKKDLSEMQHPSLNNYNYKGQNPLPFDIPSNTNSKFNMNQYQMMAPSETNNMSLWGNTVPMSEINMEKNKETSNNYNMIPQHNIPNKKQMFEIDLDDIIEDIHNESDHLDKKLEKIKALHTKIITDKKRRKREKEQKLDSL